MPVKIFIFPDRKNAFQITFRLTCIQSFSFQSGYFKCEYDENEQEKTDGGLGAGTPMFISSEIMHGSACTLL